MLAIWLQFSVSVCLFYTGVIAPSTASTDAATSESSNAAVLNRRTLLKPYRTEYDEFYKTSKNQNKGRLILNVTVETNITDPFSEIKWNAIKKLSPTSDTDEDGVNESKDPTIQNIFSQVKNLLFSKIHHWMIHSNPPKFIENYLGYQEETVDVINMAMTELFSRQRKRELRMDGLAQVFYYSCDVQNMVHTKTELTGHSYQVIGRFFFFLKKFDLFYKYDTLKLEEKNMVKNIKLNLRSIVEKTNASFGVTIPSMKMRILMHETHDDHMKLIQRRPASPKEQLVISTYVDLYRKSNDADKVNAYHLKILGVVATHVFGYVQNHVELLSELRRFPVNLNDEPVIKQFTKFLTAYMSVFIDRYFELNGAVSQKLVDALFLLMFFLDPNDLQTPDVIGLTEEEQSVLKKHTVPEFSMNVYFVSPNKNDDFDKYMWTLIDNAVLVMIETFTEEDKDSWNRFLKIEYKAELDKETLLEYMTTNSKNAINILQKFADEFTIDKRLYDLYDLNDTSSSPPNIDSFPRQPREELVGGHGST